MEILPQVFLVVSKGEPYTPGEIIELPEGEVTLGRAWEDWMPDIQFNNPYISRRHAKITNHDGTVTICDDPNSKAGVRIHGNALDKGVLYQLKHGDKISLNEDVVLIFQMGVNPGKTLSFDMNPTPKPILFDPEQSKDQVVFHETTNTIWINQKPFKSNDNNRLKLFKLLWDNRPNVVKRDDIKIALWPNKPRYKGVPSVEEDQLNSLVRLLKKDLEPYGEHIIQTSRNSGYWLETDLTKLSKGVIQ